MFSRETLSFKSRLIIIKLLGEGEKASSIMSREESADFALLEKGLCVNWAVRPGTEKRKVGQVSAYLKAGPPVRSSGAEGASSHFIPLIKSSGTGADGRAGALVPGAPPPLRAVGEVKRASRSAALLLRGPTCPRMGALLCNQGFGGGKFGIPLFDSVQVLGTLLLDPARLGRGGGGGSGCVRGLTL